MIHRPAAGGPVNSVVDPAAVPLWPRVEIEVKDDGTARVNGRLVSLPSGENLQNHLLHNACVIAKKLDRPIRVQLSDSAGTRLLVGRPDGSIAPTEPLSSAKAASLTGTGEPETSGGGISSWAIGPGTAPEKPGAIVVRPLDSTVDPERRSGPPQGPQRSPGRPRRRVYVVVGAGAVLLFLIAAAMVGPGLNKQTGDALMATRRPDGGASGAQNPPAARPPSAEAATPLAVPPPGFAAQPRWQYPLPAWTKTTISDDALVLTRSEAGQLIGLAPTTGVVVWYTEPGRDASWDGPYLSRIDDQAVIAVVRDTALVYWPLPDAAAASAEAKAATEPAPTPTTVALPAGARVTWVGSSPLVTSPIGFGVLHEGSVQPVEAPAGATGLAADGQDVLVVEGTSWSRLSTDGAAESHAFPTPPGARGAPVRVETLRGQVLFAVWPPDTEGQPAVLVNTVSGKTVLQGQLPAGIDVTRSRIIRDVAGTQLALGPVVVDATTARIHLLDHNDAPTALMRGQAYVTSADTTYVNDLSTDPTKVVGVPLTPGAAVPFAATVLSSREGNADTTRTALVLRHQDSRWVLVALRPS